MPFIIPPGSLIPQNMLNKAGETLLEALVAIVITIMAVTTASTTIVSALKSTGLSEDHLIAESLALTAMEVVANIRENNMLMDQTRKDQCINVLDNRNGLGACSSVLESGKEYIIDYDIETQKWYMAEATNNNINVSHFVDATRNEVVNYNHTAPSGSTKIPTKFSRSLQVIMPSNESDDELLLSVSVNWQQGDQQQSLVMQTAFTNYHN